MVGHSFVPVSLRGNHVLPLRSGPVQAARRAKEDEFCGAGHPVKLNHVRRCQRGANAGLEDSKRPALMLQEVNGLFPVHASQESGLPQRQQTPQRPAAKPEPKYSPEVQAVVDEGKKAQTELQHLYECIPDLAVKRKIVEIMDVSDKIVRDAIADPSDVPQIKKFLDYYLPTTIKLLNAYDRMGAQGIEGEHISGTMQSINEMLDTAIAAYKKLLDNLFANQAMDIETDIDVMNTLLKREGLAGGEGGFSAAAAATDKK